MEPIVVVQVFSSVVIFSGIISIVAYLFGRGAEYGKHATPNLNASLGPRLSWVLQEGPSFLIPVLVVYQTGLDNIEFPNKVIIALFTIHYFQRTFIYTLLMTKKATPFPIKILVMGMIFTSINGYAIAKYEASYGNFPDGWTGTVQFNAGLLLWIIGFLINLHCDYILRNLRKPGETDYKIPQGGVFELVSGGNYFGETLEWIGMAVASSFHFPATAFAFATAATLGTRALLHHKFYQEKFKKYPRNRKAIFPFIL